MESGMGGKMGYKGNNAGLTGRQARVVFVQYK